MYPRLGVVGLDYLSYSIYVLCYGAAGFVPFQRFAGGVLGAVERETLSERGRGRER